MKNKKWPVITIISFIFLALEIAAVFILILPGVNKNKMFEALRNGKGEAAADYYEKVRFFAAKDIEEDINGFLISETNGFLSGEISYNDFISRVWAVETIPDFKGASLECLKNANYFQLINLYEKGYTEEMLNSGENLFDIWDDFDDAYYAYDKKGNSLIDNYGSKADDYYSFVNKGLDDYLKTKYDSFKAGDLDSTAISSYVYVAEEFFVDDAYTDEVKTEISKLSSYEDEVRAIQALVDEGNYYDAISNAEAVIEKYDGQLYFDSYKKELKELYNKAYEEGEKDSLSKAKAAADSGDKKEANAWIDRIKEIYGDEVDTSAIEDQLVPEWAKGYIAFMDNFANSFKTVMSKGPESYKIAGKEDKIFDAAAKHADDEIVALKEIWLDDLDGNGIPELIIGEEDTPHYIFTWSKNEVIILLECGTVMAYEDGGYIYTHASYDAEEEDAIEYDMLWQIKGTGVESISVTIKSEEGENTTYIVDSDSNGEGVSEEEYSEAREKIVDKCSQSLNLGTELKDYKTFIESYEE